MNAFEESRSVSKIKVNFQKDSKEIEFRRSDQGVNCS